MADRQINELDPVKEVPIGDLPQVLDIYDDSLIPLEQQGMAMRMTGRQFRQFGEKTAEMYVGTAVEAAADAEAAKTGAETARDAAKASQTAAAGSASAASTSAANAKKSEDAAKASQTAAKGSEDKAAASATAAKTSETTAKGHADAAKTAQTGAETARDAAKASQTAAAGSADAAAKSATAAEASKTAAAGSASAAAQSAMNAAASAKNVENMSNMAESYAVGGTDTRPNEDADNAKYYYEQAKGISQGLAGSLLPMGTVAFAALKNQTKEPGYMYNISDAFTTDATFKEGAGHPYPAGTNVYYTADGYWDCLAGAQVVSVNGETGAVTVKKLISSSSVDPAATVVFGSNATDIWLAVSGVTGADMYDSVNLVINKSTGLTKLDFRKNGALTQDQLYSTKHPQPSVAGNAGTATKLNPGHKINNVLFDGSQDITVRDNLKLPISNNVNAGTAGTDFNTLTAPGYYMRQGTNTNAPTTGDSHYHVLVLSLTDVTNPSSDSKYIRQVAYDIRSTALWTRSLINGSWKAWERLYTTGNKPVAADVGAVAKAGDTMTGPLTANGGIVLNSVSYGTALPSTGTPGQLFLLKVQ